MRTPWDGAVYPAGIPAIATYSILPDPLEALARALAGEIGFPGRSPVEADGSRSEPLEPDDLGGHSPLYACRPLNQSEPE